MSDLRQIIENRLREQGKTMAWLSRQLGRNHAYIQQFIRTHKPLDLEFLDKLKVAKLLNISASEIGIDQTVSVELPLQGAHQSPVEEGAKLWEPPPGHFLTLSEQRLYFIARSRALDRHEFKIHENDIVVVDINHKAISLLKTGNAVVVDLFHKPDGARSTSVLREYIEPDLLITNSSGANSIWRVDDGSLPFEIVIRGKVTSVIRGGV